MVTDTPEPVDPDLEAEIEPIEEEPVEEVVEQPVEEVRSETPVEVVDAEPQDDVEMSKPQQHAALVPLVNESSEPVMPMPQEAEPAITLPFEAEPLAEQPEVEDSVIEEQVSEVEPQQAEPVKPETVVADVVAAPVPTLKPKIERPKKRVVKKRKPVAQGNSQRNESRGATRGSNTAETGDGGRKATSNYLGGVNARLQRAKRYPRRARGAEGTVFVRFKIARSGAVSGLRVVRSSGNADLDEAALSNVKRVSPFPNFPSEMRQKSQTVTVPFRYTAP
ncbi:energy transducer TonB [Breoghania sp.]|uniref:energy transducer TonB n=1 Tax=Breoghania sp. TaxID=2065378 RepID=UPI00262230AC|nr:energy transducer TonB [Breoghania sp.]MDJ0932745.1 energy transducer TonB [Breoghania sp.]